MNISVIVCAGGKGSRAGFEKNKLLTPLPDFSANGKSVLWKTLSAFNFDKISEIVVATAKCDYDEVAEICKDFPTTKVVLGGNSRAETVKNALQSVSGEIVLIHDGARPFVTQEVIENCIRSVEQNGSGICAVPVTDTVAVVQDGVITDVPNRNTLYNVQTPQGFYLKDIAYAYARANKPLTKYTDDSSVYAETFGTVSICDGSTKNVKLTYAQDFLAPARVGFGVDTHAFGKDQDYITLCGVKIPSKSGLIAHSDGDVAIHALMDALLSALGLRDIGYYFPDTDEKYKGANSISLLNEVMDKVFEKGFSVANVSIAIQAEKPKLAKFIPQMKLTLSSILKIAEENIGITAGTNEKLGYVGEGKGITVYANVLLQ